MASFTGLIFLVAYAALLLVGCNARNRHPKPSRRNADDAAISLGLVEGSNIITLPPVHVSGPDVVVGFPDNCAAVGLELTGTVLIVTDSAGGKPVDLVANDANNPLSKVAIHCKGDPEVSLCSEGLDLTSYQYCGDLLPALTTGAPTTAEPDSTSSSSTSTSTSSSSSTSTSSSSSTSTSTSTSTSSED